MMKTTATKEASGTNREGHYAWQDKSSDLLKGNGTLCSFNHFHQVLSAMFGSSIFTEFDKGKESDREGTKPIYFASSYFFLKNSSINPFPTTNLETNIHYVNTIIRENESTIR